MNKAATIGDMQANDDVGQGRTVSCAMLPGLSGTTFWKACMHSCEAGEYVHDGKPVNTLRSLTSITISPRSSRFYNIPQNTLSILYGGQLKLLMESTTKD